MVSVSRLSGVWARRVLVRGSFQLCNCCSGWVVHRGCVVLCHARVAWLTDLGWSRDLNASVDLASCSRLFWFVLVLCLLFVLLLPVCWSD